jgi:hypothetical protein
LHRRSREFAQEVKQNFKYAPAEGIKMVEYDAYGLPKTEEIQKMKAELNMKDDDVFKEDGTQVLFIKPPEEYRLHGYHKNVDVERKDMNPDMREVYDMMEEADAAVAEEDCIDDDFLNMLNENQPALVERQIPTEEEKASNEFDEFGDLAGTEEEAMEMARLEAEEFMKNMPPGLSEEMQARLAGARKHLTDKNMKNGDDVDREELEANFEGILDEYNDDEIGAMHDEMMDPLTDMIDQEAFDEIMQEFIEDNKEHCKKLYSKYHKDDFATKINVEGENIEEIAETDLDLKEKVYKILKQKNGDVVKLVPKEEMQRLQERLNADEIELQRQKLKSRILKYHAECLKKEAEGDSEESEESEEDQEKQWDVETVLTTRTNTDNHPGVIKSVIKPKKNKIKIDPKTKAPQLDVEYTGPERKRPEKTGPYIEEMVSDEDSEEELDTEELANLETMNEKERKKYLRKMNKKQVKKERKERRQQKKQTKKEFSKQHQNYTKINTAKQGELKPGVSVRRI